MEIYNRNDSPYNFGPHLQPLFDAMKEGKVIKSVIYKAGIVFKNFKAFRYWVSIGDNQDLVDIVPDNNAKHMFSMNNVISFEL